MKPKSILPATLLTFIALGSAHAQSAAPSRSVQCDPIDRIVMPYRPPQTPFVERVIEELERAEGERLQVVPLGDLEFDRTTGSPRFRRGGTSRPGRRRIEIATMRLEKPAESADHEAVAKRIAATMSTPSQPKAKGSCRIVTTIVVLGTVGWEMRAALARDSSSFPIAPDRMLFVATAQRPVNLGKPAKRDSIERCARTGGSGDRVHDWPAILTSGAPLELDSTAPLRRATFELPPGAELRAREIVNLVVHLVLPLPSATLTEKGISRAMAARQRAGECQSLFRRSLIPAAAFEGERDYGMDIEGIVPVAAQTLTTRDASSAVLWSASPILEDTVTLSSWFDQEELGRTIGKRLAQLAPPTVSDDDWKVALRRRKAGTGQWTLRHIDGLRSTLELSGCRRIEGGTHGVCDTLPDFNRDLNAKGLLSRLRAGDTLSVVTSAWRRWTGAGLILDSVSLLRIRGSTGTGDSWYVAPRAGGYKSVLRVTRPSGSTVPCVEPTISVGDGGQDDRFALIACDGVNVLEPNVDVDSAWILRRADGSTDPLRTQPMANGLRIERTTTSPDTALLEYQRPDDKDLLVRGTTSLVFGFRCEGEVCRSLRIGVALQWGAAQGREGRFERRPPAQCQARGNGYFACTASLISASDAMLSKLQALGLYLPGGRYKLTLSPLFVLHRGGVGAP